MEYQQGCRVVYGIHGVCNVLASETRRIDRKNVEYYVLQPVDQTESRYYVPKENAGAVKKIRPILLREEVDNLLEHIETTQTAWIDDDNLRKLQFKNIIAEGDRAQLLCMIRLLYQHKREQIASGKKFHASDENLLRDAERLIISEFSVVLNMTAIEASLYLHDVIEKN